MEQARLVIAIALSFVIFIVWGLFFGPEETPPQKETPTVAQTQESGQPTYQEAPPLSEDTAQQPTEALTVRPDPVETPKRDLVPTTRVITVNTPLYEVQITEKGAAFNRFVLKDYKESMAENAPLKAMIGNGSINENLHIGFQKKSISNLDQRLFKADLSADTVTVAQEPMTIRFNWISTNGLAVEKQYRFDPQSYLIDTLVTVSNRSQLPFQDALTISLAKTFSEKDIKGYGFVGPSTLMGKTLEQIDVDDIKEKSTYQGELRWVGIQDRYFIASIIPKNVHPASLFLQYEKEGRSLKAVYIENEETLQPGQQKQYDYHVYMGPKSMKLLKQFDNGLDKAINFGMFDILAKPCLWIMNYIHDNIVANYGVAIILLTILVKIIFWPLGTKSYKSMGEMKKIQPLMAEIREKYKNDKKKMNEEVMGLYRTYKINPMGGCLPMVVQIPVFFALYRMLYEAIELRHAPFFLWINDLSAPDRLFEFEGPIPFMEPPFGIPVLTVVMGASMLLQQKMSPPMGDPTQAKMMMIMPIVFTFIFINFSSGLVLYWLVNNLLSIGQQKYIQNKYA